MVKVRNKKQKLRFALVGFVSTALDFSLLVGLRSTGLPAIPANIISSTTAFCISFVANKKFTFRSSGDSLKQEIFRYAAITLFGLWVIQSIIIGILEPFLESFGIHTSLALLIAKFLATFVTLIWNYTLYSRLVFKNSSAQ